MGLSELPDYYKKFIESEAERLMAIIISGRGKAESDLDLSDWNAIARALAIEFVAQNYKLDSVMSVGNDFVDKFRKRKQQDKDRIKNRPDQVDKRAFQEAASLNMDDYLTKADAIRDLKIKPQFSDYPDKTLRDWLKDIWGKPTVLGRPKKARR